MHKFERFVGATRGQSIQPARKFQVETRRETFIQVLLLEDDANALFQLRPIFDHVASCNGGAAATGIDLTSEHTDSGCLACSVWPQQPKDCAAPRLKTDTRYGYCIAKLAPQVTRLDH